MSSKIGNWIPKDEPAESGTTPAPRDRIAAIVAEAIFEGDVGANSYKVADVLLAAFPVLAAEPATADEDEYWTADRIEELLEEAMAKASDLWDDDVAFIAIVERFIEHYAALDAAIEAARAEDDYDDEKPIWFRWDSASMELVRDTPPVPATESTTDTVRLAQMARRLYVADSWGVPDAGEKWDDGRAFDHEMDRCFRLAEAALVALAPEPAEHQWQRMYSDHLVGDREFLQQVADAFGIRTDQVTTAFLERQAAAVSPDEPTDEEFAEDNADWHRVSPDEPKPQGEQREEWRLRNLMPGGKPGPITDTPPDPRHTLGCAIEHRTITTTPWSHYPKDGQS